MANDLGGVWRTIGGRRVFIKDGQDLASAMKESGKFKKKKPEPFSKEDYAERDEKYQKLIDEGVYSKEEVEYFKAKKDYEIDKISREQFDKIKDKLDKKEYTPTTEELRDKIKAQYKDWNTTGQVQRFADETVAKMPKDTQIDVKEYNQYHDVHSIYRKDGNNEWTRTFVENPGASDEKVFWENKVKDYDVIEGMYNSFENGESATVDKFKVVYPQSQSDKDDLMKEQHRRYIKNQQWKY